MRTWCAKHVLLGVLLLALQVTATRVPAMNALRIKAYSNIPNQPELKSI